MANLLERKLGLRDVNRDSRPRSIGGELDFALDSNRTRLSDGQLNRNVRVEPYLLFDF
mgnify:FL=1